MCNPATLNIEGSYINVIMVVVFSSQVQSLTWFLRRINPRWIPWRRLYRFLTVGPHPPASYLQILPIDPPPPRRGQGQRVHVLTLSQGQQKVHQMTPQFDHRLHCFRAVSCLNHLLKIQRNRSDTRSTRFSPRLANVVCVYLCRLSSTCDNLCEEVCLCFCLHLVGRIVLMSLFWSAWNFTIID